MEGQRGREEWRERTRVFIDERRGTRRKGNVGGKWERREGMEGCSEETKWR